MDSCGEYFLFYGLTDFVIFSSGLKVWLLLVQDSFRFLYPESWHETRVLSRQPHLQNWFSYSLFLLTEEGGYFHFWDSSQSFGFYLLPSSVRRFVRATICPCTPFFTHPVTKYKHLLVSILTWICYLRNWPKFLFQQSVLGLFKYGGIVVIPHFSSLSGRPRDKLISSLSLFSRFFGTIPRSLTMTVTSMFDLSRISFILN